MPQRVLFTASTFAHIVHFHLPYLRAFRAMGWAVDVACGGEAAAIPEAERCIALPFEKRMSAPANFRAERMLRRLMAEERYALVTTHTSLAAFFTRRAAAALRPRPPLACVCHGYLFDDETPLPRRAVLRAAERLTAAQTDLLLTMNAYDEATARRARLARRIEHIPGMGVDFSRLDAMRADRDAVRASLGFVPADRVLLFAAEFSARKNHAMLLRALAALPAPVKLLLPGSGELLPDCRALARRLGLDSRVVFPGYVADMAPLYRAADAAVSASRSEGLPFNIMEAMYAGLPVVASRVKGHTDLLDDRRTGLLFPYDDDAAFAAAVRELLDRPELAAALGRAAHDAVLPFALPQALPRVMDLYLSLLPAELRRAQNPLDQE